MGCMQRDAKTAPQALGLFVSAATPRLPNTSRVVFYSGMRFWELGNLGAQGLKYFWKIGPWKLRNWDSRLLLLFSASDSHLLRALHALAALRVTRWAKFIALPIPLRMSQKSDGAAEREKRSEAVPRHIQELEEPGNRDMGLTTLASPPPAPARALRLRCRAASAPFLL